MESDDRWGVARLVGKSTSKGMQSVKYRSHGVASLPPKEPKFCSLSALSVVCTTFSSVFHSFALKLHLKDGSGSTSRGEFELQAKTLDWPLLSGTRGWSCRTTNSKYFMLQSGYSSVPLGGVLSQTPPFAIHTYFTFQGPT